MKINKYEIVYGDVFKCKRIIWATSVDNVIEYCETRFPNIMPLQEINLIEEDVSRESIRSLF